MGLTFRIRKGCPLFTLLGVLRRLSTGWQAQIPVDEREGGSRHQCGGQHQGAQGKAIKSTGLGHVGGSKGCV